MTRAKWLRTVSVHFALLFAVLACVGCGIAGSKIPTPNAPQFSQPAGSYTAPVSISISDSSGITATIFYTINGPAPTSASARYPGPISLPVGTTTLQAVAYNNGNYSAVTSAIYNVAVAAPTPPAAPNAPQFSQPAGSYTALLSIAISDPGSSTAAIYYTINGATPTSASTPYVSPVSIPVGTETLQAVAYSNGNYSAVTSATYNVVAAAPNPPQFSQPAGSYTAPLSIAISDPGSSSAAIYYTTNGATPTTASTPYVSPVSIPVGTETLEAVAYANGSYSAVTSATYVVASATPNAPQFSQPAGSYTAPLSIAISDPGSSSAAIYYTINGSTPTTASTPYAGPVTIPVGTETLQAVAYANGNYSTVTSATYVVASATPNAPQFSQPAGSYTAPLSIAISDPGSSSAAIYYTINGATPTSASTPYTGPVSIPVGTETLEAVAYSNGNYSAVTSATYVVASATPNAPQFSQPAGSYTAPLSIAISDPGSSSAAIYYTINGSTPTTASTPYAGPVSIPVGTETLEAVAYSNGNYSAVASATYVVASATPNAPQFSLVAGSYTAPVSITITDPGSSSAAIYYTINGATPTTASTPYTGPVSLAVGTETLQAVAYANGNYSTVTSATYVVSSATPNAPLFSLAAGIYTAPVSITITDPGSSSAAIYYTINGATPTSASTPYTNPVSLAVGTETLKAVAYLNSNYSPVTSAVYTVVQPGPLVTVDGSSGVPVSAHDFGVNNIWYYIPDTAFDEFSHSLLIGAGMTYMRYPGGYESEHYNWSDNTLDPNYRNYTDIPGVTPAHLISNLGVGNVSFVMRTEDALEAGTVAEYQLWAAQAANLVTQYGGQVHDWQIGNEWYNDGGASANYQEFLARYSALVSYFAPAMKAAAAQAGFSINIYVSCNWVNPDDMTTMKNEVGPAAWADVDGADLHIYSGVSPDQSKTYVQLPISSITPTINTIKANGGKDLVYVSEWMADLEDDNKYGGLQDANIMMQMFGQFARAGITAASYWPPVFPTNPQADKITLVGDTSNYFLDADGQAMGWISGNYRGSSLATTTTNTLASSIAALNGNQLVVFVMTNTAGNETEQLQVNGFPWSTIVSAQVMYAAGTNVSKGPASITTLPTSVTTLNGQKTAQFVVNPGGSGRGTEWEIVKLVLQ